MNTKQSTLLKISNSTDLFPLEKQQMLNVLISKPSNPATLSDILRASSVLHLKLHISVAGVLCYSVLIIYNGFPLNNTNQQLA